MCLVEIEKFPKPVASCAMPLADNMVIYVDTPLVRKARESVLEFLLINHPLDCPICDQGGECDLQDQTIKYGSNQSRFLLKHKRGVEDKNFGPLIKTVMTRCIHCTRCVRFADEIAGVGFRKEKGHSLGTSGRGTHVEIGFYIDKIFNSELSGNVIDLCPVGALTSKPQAFEYRSWELENYTTIDTNDGLGIPIQVDVKDNKIVRVKPSKPSQSFASHYNNNNQQVGFEIAQNTLDTWISDKVRYSFDGINYQRLSNPTFLKNSKMPEINNTLDWWFSSVLFLSYFVNIDNSYSEKVSLLGNISCESLGQINTLNDSFGGTVSSTVESLISTPICLDFESDYKNLNKPDKSDKNENNDFILIISNNLRYEFPNLNVKLKNLQQKQNLKIGYIGTNYDNTYNMEHLGLSLDVLEKILKGKHKYSIYLKKAKNPKILMGSLTNLNSYKKGGSSNQFNTEFTLKTVQKIFKNFGRYYKNENNDIILFLPTALGSTGAMDIGIKKAVFKKRKKQKNIGQLSSKSLIHLIKADNLSKFETNTLLKIKNSPESKQNVVTNQIILQGHHWNNIIESPEIFNNFNSNGAAALSNSIVMTIPTTTSFETKQTFINLEGDCRSTNSVLSGSDPFKNEILFFNILNKMQNIYSNQIFSLKNKTEKNFYKTIFYGKPLNTLKGNILEANQNVYKSAIKLLNTKLNTRISNFYKTDLISQNSIILTKVALSNFKSINKNF